MDSGDVASVISSIEATLESLTSRDVDILLMTALLSGKMEQLKSLVAHESFSNSIKGSVRGESLRFQTALAALGKCTDVRSPGAAELITQMSTCFSRIKTSLGVLSRSSSSPPPPPSHSPSPPPLSSSPSPSAAIALSSSGTRSRSGSFMNVPRKIRALTIGSPASSPTLSSSGERSFSPPNSLTTSGGSHMSVTTGSTSPPHPSEESLQAFRRAAYPSYLCWTIGNDLDIPDGFTAEQTQQVLCSFFDAMFDLKDADLSVPPVVKTHSNPFKSPRVFSKQKARTETENQITQAVTAVLPLLERNTWSELFHARLSLKGTPLTGQALDTIARAAAFAAASPMESLPSESHHHVDALVKFLRTYELDVESAIVGVELHHSLRAGYVFSPVEMQGEPVEAKPEATKKSDLRALREKIISISELPNAEAAFAEIKELAQVFRHEELYSLKEGDLVVAQWWSGLDGFARITFCRVAKWVDQTHLEIFNGRTLVTVKATQCQPLTPGVKKLIEAGRYSEVVVDHYGHLKALLVDCMDKFIFERLLHPLEENKVMMRRVEQVLKGDGNFTLYDFDVVRTLADWCTTIDILVAAEPGLIQQLGQIHVSYCDGLTLHHISAKDRDSVISQMLALGRSLQKLVVNRYDSIAVKLQGAFARLNQESERIMDGTRKAEMSSTWLTNVREAVNQLLDGRGYDPNASPHDYISCAPKSLAAIRINLNILQGLLTNRDKSNALAIVSQGLRERIYPGCQKFVDEAILVLVSQLRCTLLPEKDAVAQLKEIIDAKSKANDTSLDKRVKDVLSDILYLREMRRLEDHPQEKNPHIVPVSGLVISSIVRKEKEMATIIEVWDGRANE